MNTIVITILLAVGIVAMLMAGLGVKMIVKKNGEFKRHCSSMDPYTGQGAGCVCAQAANAKCKNAERYSPLEVNANLMKEISD
jgi:hypothetical protein